MTDIYDFRDEVFKTYKKEWSIIFKAIWKYVEVKQNPLSTEEYYTFFKKHAPYLWEKCSDTIISDFILRAFQISNYELIDIPGKNRIT